MSTSNAAEEARAIDTMDIPSEDAVKVIAKKAWRFSKGKIVQGRAKEDGGFDATRDKIVGRLERVGIYEGRGKSDGIPYKQVEADFLGSDGNTIYVKASLNDGDITDRIVIKPAVSAIKFAWGLTQFNKGDIVMIEASRSRERVKMPNGREGDFVTYVNWFRHAGGSNFEPVYSPKRDKNAAPNSLADQWAELEPLIKAHDAYAERSTDFEDEEDGTPATHLSWLGKEAKAKGWPTPDEQPGKWLELVAKAFGESAPKARLSDYSDDEWGQIRFTLQDRDECPKTLRPAEVNVADL